MFKHPKILKALDLLKDLPILFDPTPYQIAIKNHPSINKNNPISQELKELKKLRKMYDNENNSNESIKLKVSQHVDII